MNKLSECHLAGVQQTSALRAECWGALSTDRLGPEGNDFSYKSQPATEQVGFSCYPAQ